jgi:hypothetical protein
MLRHDLHAEEFELGHEQRERCMREDYPLADPEHAVGQYGNHHIVRVDALGNCFGAATSTAGSPSVRTVVRISNIGTAAAA